MDVGAPNNWERIEHLFEGDLEALRRVLRWGAKTDEETEATIRDLHAQGYLADPHAAVAYGVLADRLAPGETGVFLGTAHPAKFLPVYESDGDRRADPRVAQRPGGPAAAGAGDPERGRGAGGGAGGRLTVR